MNIAKIKEALADAVEAKEHAEADSNSDYAYWQGYEEGILMALAQTEEFVKTIKELLNEAQIEVASQNYEPERFTFWEGVEETYLEVLKILFDATDSN